MEDVKIAINPQGLSQFVSDSVKDSFEFGLQIGQAIQYEWFRKDGAKADSIINGRTSIGYAYMLEESNQFKSIKTN